MPPLGLGAPLAPERHWPRSAIPPVAPDRQWPRSAIGLGAPYPRWPRSAMPRVAPDRQWPRSAIGLGAPYPRWPRTAIAPLLRSLVVFRSSKVGREISLTTVRGSPKMTSPNDARSLELLVLTGSLRSMVLTP
ncbi:hypothetical protein QAD02_021552 [Eretmocerus hayati]|uniref:Uncharacterized protein n=1 Tax=Eretmocerus hayati TaxID=131215 RepID=A0ACC2PT27_9HYME|nr:hypothetical protein QAD02_021552 [Eretmocerus hayati]